MIEVSGIRLPLARLDGDPAHELEAARSAALRACGLSPADVDRFELRKRSIDARRKDDIRLLFTVRLGLKGGPRAERALVGDDAAAGGSAALCGPGPTAPGRPPRGPRHHGGHRRGSGRGRQGRPARPANVRIVDEQPYLPPRHEGRPPETRPVVVGAGCAGLFCALALAEAGLAPILVERGDDCARRSERIRLLERTGELDPESNVQFGLGGAGTFSDGKLATGTKSASHRWILEALVEAGAARSILWDAKPHVGSDVLPQVVDALVARIEEAGGELRLRTQMSGIEMSGGGVRSITVSTADPATGMRREERLPCSRLVLACGHSARDVYELLRNAGVTLERKTFAMGVRIEHLQADIDRAQYGRHAGHPALGAAPYKLATHTDGDRGVFSFCMCPGGYVVAAASEAGGVVTNGMSLSDRAGTNANAGLLANVFPQDLPGDDPLAGIDLQRGCEQAAYAAGGGGYVAPAQLLGDFLAGRPSTAAGRVAPTYPRGVTWGSVDGCLPAYVTDALREALPHLERRLRGFSVADAVLTGVETRSSSPVRVTRDADGQAVGVRGLFPCGEGAGYAGGIMSAAADGLRTAAWLIDSLG